MLNDYVDLTNPDLDIESISIVPDGFDCNLLDTNKKAYKGFLLAKSEGGNAYTVCDVKFQWSSKDHKYPARLELRRTNGKLEDKPINKGHRHQRMAFTNGQDGYREFWKMIAFLSKFKEQIDLSQFFDRFQVVTDKDIIIHLNKLSPAERLKELEQFAIKSKVSAQELSEVLALRSRKEDLITFEALLKNKDDYYSVYRDLHSGEMKGNGKEAVWHHFLSKHKWIFGLSLDLRFIEDFVDEAAVGNPSTDDTGNPHADMLAWGDYTILIELKTPETNIFTETKTKNARTNTWSFTPEFIEGFSQCLAQKTDWEENHTSKKITHEKDGQKYILNKGIIRTIDPQVIYIVGNKELEIPKNSALENVAVKRDTLERLIRNNRNINIISYDELYRRAFYIVYGELPIDEENDHEEVNLDDLPW